MRNYKWNPDRGCYEAHPIANYRCVVWQAELFGFPWQWEVRRFGRRSLHVTGSTMDEDHAKKIARAAAFALAGPKAVPL